MYQSIPCLTTPRATPGGSHILVAPGVGFSLLCLARGVLNQSKSSITLKKSAIFALSLKQMSSSSFHMFIYARGEQCDLGPIYWNSSWSKFHRIQDVYMANMPKKTKLCSRFLLLRIYPDSPVHTSANTGRIQICPVTL